MSNNSLIISKGLLKKNELSGKVAIVTGAGGGIGFEAARALIWLGAKVIIAEFNKEKGLSAEKRLNNEFGENSALFVHTDVGDEKSINKLVKISEKKYGFVDILFNNATIAPIGAVDKVGIDKWDLSYKTNLRGPVLLVSALLPKMIDKKTGIIVFVPSSGAAPYMGAYEVFKTAQVELSNTLIGELEGTGVITYSIGPGIVKTETAENSIKQIAPLYHKTIEEFYKMNESVLISVEEAGAGFAASVSLANKYNGLEVSSIQALADARIKIEDNKPKDNKIITEESREAIITLFSDIKTTLFDQIKDWENRPIFERQWVSRDFKKYIGYSSDQFMNKINDYENDMKNSDGSIAHTQVDTFQVLKKYYNHQIELLKGYEKNQEKVKEYTNIMNKWIEQIDKYLEKIEKVL